jgi:hypothetical protein
MLKIAPPMGGVLPIGQEQEPRPARPTAGQGPRGSPNQAATTLTPGGTPCARSLPTTLWADNSCSMVSNLRGCLHPLADFRLCWPVEACLPDNPGTIRGPGGSQRCGVDLQSETEIGSLQRSQECGNCSGRKD